MPAWQGDYNMERTTNPAPRPIDYPDHYRPHSINRPHQIATPRNVLYSTPEISGHRRNFVGGDSRAPHNPPRHHYYTRQSEASEVDSGAGWVGEDWDREVRARTDAAQDSNAPQNPFLTSGINRHHVPRNHQEDNHQPHHDQPQREDNEVRDYNYLQNILLRVPGQPQKRVYATSLSAEGPRSNTELFWSAMAPANLYPRAMRDRWSGLTFSLALCELYEMRNPAKYIMFHFKPRTRAPNAGGWLIFQLFPEKQVTLKSYGKGREGEKPFALLRTNSVGTISIREPDPDDTARSIIESLSSCLRGANGTMELRVELVKEGAIDTLRNSWFREPKHFHSSSTAPSPSITTSSPALSLRESTSRYPGATIATTDSSQPYKNNIVGSRVTGIKRWGRDMEQQKTLIAISKAHISEQPLRGQNSPLFVPPRPAQETTIADREVGPSLEPKAAIPAARTEVDLSEDRLFPKKPPSASLEPWKEKKAKPMIKQEPESDGEDKVEEPVRKKKKQRRIPVVDSDTETPGDLPRKKRKRIKLAEPEPEPEIAENGVSDVEQSQRKKKKKSKPIPLEPEQIPTAPREKKTKKTKESVKSKRKNKRTPLASETRSLTPPAKTSPPDDLDSLQKRLAEINHAKNELFVEEQELKAKLLRQKFDQSKQGGGSDGKSILHCTCSACGEYGHRKDSWKCPNHQGRKRALG